MDPEKSLDPDLDAMKLDPKHCFPVDRIQGSEIFFQGGSWSAAWDPQHFGKPDPDPHQSENQNQDPQQRKKMVPDPHQN